MRSQSFPGHAPPGDVMSSGSSRTGDPSSSRSSSVSGPPGAKASPTWRNMAFRPWGRLLDARLNRRTAASLAAPHSKATLTEAKRSAFGETEATHDGTVHLRPPARLKARTRHGDIDLTAVARVLGEVAIPERAFMDGLRLEGELRAVLLVEHLGVWRDLPSPQGWLFAHVPGWDTATVAHLFERVAHVPVVHFGDLDPNGMRIYVHLRERRPDLRWFIPPFWAHFVDSHGLRAPWPSDLDLGAAPALIRELATRGLWLEQERLVLDPRITEALEQFVREGPQRT